MMGKILYLIARFIFLLYFLLFLKWKINGKENRPAQGPLVIMSNHISALDPPVVGCIMNRQVYFMAKEELFKNRIVSWALKMIGTFPIKRGKADLKALKNAFMILKKGQVLGIFPEGTRHTPGSPGRAKPGAITIPIKTRTPILPVGIKYDQGLKISIGRIFTLDKYYDRKLSKEEIKEAGELIMKKISAEIERL
jgi:1-acyl-sn-glycerol-3-phosphate acyltransferase